MKKKYRFKSQESWDVFQRSNEKMLVDSISGICKYPNWFTMETDHLNRPIVVGSDSNYFCYHPGWSIPFSRKEIDIYLEEDEIIGVDISKNEMIEWAIKDPKISEYIKDKFTKHKIKEKELVFIKELRDIKIREDEIYKELECIGSYITKDNFKINIEE